jgi:hypothetical protein
MAIAVGTACGSGFLDGLSGGQRLGPNDGAPADSALGPEAGAGLEGGSGCLASFCDDFDHGPLGATWTDSGVTANGSIALVEAGLSPPFAFQAAYEGGVPNTTADIETNIGSRSVINCEVDVRFVSPPPMGEVDYLTFVSIMDNFVLYKVYLAVFNGTWNLGEYGIFTDGGKLDRSKGVPTPPIDTWTHVRFVMDTRQKTLSISFDGQPTTTLGALTQYFSTTREVHIGINFASANAASSSALYDNVACDYGL